MRRPGHLGEDARPGNSGAWRPDPSIPAALLPSADALTKLHGPVLLINGAGRTATVFHPGGGEYANVASSWLLWQFKGDERAKTMFVGDNCGLCTNPNWDVAAKRLGK